MWVQSFEFKIPQWKFDAMNQDRVDRGRPALTMEQFHKLAAAAQAERRKRDRQRVERMMS
jgi:hypothetical protein